MHMKTWWSHTIGLATAVCLVATVGCRDQEPPAPVLVTCAGFPFPSSVFDGPARAEQGVDAAAVELRRVLATGEAGVSFPPGGWRELSRTADTVEFGLGTPPFLAGYVILRAEPAGWRIAASGDRCVVERHIPASAPAAWGIDPAAGPPPGKDATEVAVLVSDSQCAGGRSAEERVRAPDVQTFRDRVVVTFMADPVIGGAACPGHAPARRIVHLPGPLGERVLLDGGLYPPQPPCSKAERQGCAGITS